jgi:hypothetical protein
LKILSFASHSTKEIPILKKGVKMSKGILRVLGVSLIFTAAACGRDAAVTNTWFSFDNYSFNIEVGEDAPELELSPSLRVMPKSDEFKGTLKLTLRYPLPEERLDVMVVDVFSERKPKVKLPKIKVKVYYLLLDELIEDHSFEEPVLAEAAWKSYGTYALKSGQERNLKIAGAANHRLVVIRSDIYDEAGEELLLRYLHGFEVE